MKTVTLDRASLDEQASTLCALVRAPGDDLRRTVAAAIAAATAGLSHGKPRGLVAETAELYIMQWNPDATPVGTHLCQLAEWIVMISEHRIASGDRADHPSHHPAYRFADHLYRLDFTRDLCLQLHRLYLRYHARPASWKELRDGVAYGVGPITSTAALRLMLLHVAWPAADAHHDPQQQKGGSTQSNRGDGGADVPQKDAAPPNAATAGHASRVKFGSTGPAETAQNQIVSDSGAQGNSLSNEGGLEAPSGFEPLSKGFADSCPGPSIPLKTETSTIGEFNSRSNSGQIASLKAGERYFYFTRPDAPATMHIWREHVGILCGDQECASGSVCERCHSVLTGIRIIEQFWPLGTPPSTAPTRLDLLIRAILPALRLSGERPRVGRLSA